MLSRSRTHNQINSVTTFRSICLAPVNELLRGSAAANALVRELLLIKGDAARADLGQLLDLILARLVAAPHCADEAVAVSRELFNDLIHRLAVVGTAFAVRESLLVHTVADLPELFSDRGLEVIERDGSLLKVVAGERSMIGQKQTAAKTSSLVSAAPMAMSIGS